MGMKFVVLIWLICGVSDSVDEGANARVILRDSNCRYWMCLLMRETKRWRIESVEPGFDIMRT